MSFGESIATCFRKYADFSGRARRSEYWWFALFYGICYVVTVILTAAKPAFVILLLIVVLGLLLPLLAAAARRLHDTGRSGWWILIGLIPLGGFVLLFFYVQDTVPQPNQWGPPAKNVGAAGGYGQVGDGGYGAPPPPPPPPAG